MNLVGGFAAGGKVHETAVEEFETQFRLNLRPTYLMTQAAVPVMLERGDGGSIVCVGTRAALQPFPGAAGYIASKAAVIAFAQAVAAEYRQDGIRCNAILPSVIDTPANRAAMPDAEARAVGAAGRDRGRDRAPPRRRRADQRRGDPGLRPGVTRPLGPPTGPGRGPLAGTGPTRPTGRSVGSAPMERKWWTLIVVCVGTFMLLLDITIVNVALPKIAVDLKASFSDIQWVIDAYALTLASVLLTDRRARRPVRPPAGVLDRPACCSRSPRCCARCRRARCS